MSWYNGKRYQQRSSKLRAQHLHEKNVKTAQENTLKREAASGEAYAKKMQADYNRGKAKKAYADRQRDFESRVSALGNQNSESQSKKQPDTRSRIVQALKKR